MENVKVLRNENIDIVRGIAIILVLTGHIITNNTTSAYDTLLYNIIWSLQMPLFMLISGYITKYSKQISNKNEYFIIITKRSLAYLLPWLMWTIVRWSISGNINIFSYFKGNIYSAGSGYWYLLSLWTIIILFSTASLFANKFTKNNLYIFSITIVLSILFACFLLVLGEKVGMSFFCIKLTLYYIPFFLIGYSYAYIEKFNSEKTWFNKLKSLIIFPALVIYFVIIVNVNLYSASDTVFNILIRATASLLGCMIVFCTISNIHTNLNGKVHKSLVLAGKYSLELYLVHETMISIIKVVTKPELWSIAGITLCLINFALMLFLSIIIIIILSSNKWSRLMIFGKK